MFDPKLTREEVLAQVLLRIKEIYAVSGDTERVHVMADDLLCDLLLYEGYDELVDWYHRLDKWYA